ncbi:MAG: type II toxin-antitoxin system RelE/ParE family toxin [Gammaproteobacteria bacterium]|nr:MAG: type II toxin-antitoxin system RelE/ParE family toxin [Gammaproteobacteria bacterium]
MRLEWTRLAVKDIQEAGHFIASDNPSAARRMAQRVREAVEHLVDQPNIGRPGRVQGTRELVISGTPFIAIYWVRGDAVTILRLLHHARQWP